MKNLFFSQHWKKCEKKPQIRAQQLKLELIEFPHRQYKLTKY